MVRVLNDYITPEWATDSPPRPGLRPPGSSGSARVYLGTCVYFFQAEFLRRRLQSDP